MSRLLELKSLSGGYGAVRVLHGIDLHVEEGSITALLGANGAGKTTVLRAVSRMIATQGVIRFGGESIASKTTEQLARLGVGHVPDGRGTFASMTVAENLALGALGRRAGGAGGDAASDLDMVHHYFPRLKQRANQAAGTLSGGEQQMLAIGRALMARPRLLLLDEPSVGLAPILVNEIFSIMKTINAERGVSMLLVEQNAAKALALAHHAFVLETGRVVLGGSARDIARDDRVKQAYLGH